MTKLKMGIAAFALVAGAAIALGQGQGAFPNYPIVGGAAYCSSLNNGVCTNTVAAGPTAVTGNESIPANTNLANGSSPQNVLMSMRALNAGPADYQAITNGSAFYTYTFGNNTRKVIFVASGAISDERVTAPPAPMDGQEVSVDSVTTITVLAFIANSGQSLAATTPTVLTASTTAPQGYTWRYRASNTTWYRVQ